MAGAPPKKGLDYFSLDVDIEQDQKIELMEAEFGLKGFAILIKLFLRIYGDEGYFLKWNSDTQLLLAKRVGEPGSFVGEVVNGSVRRGLFNKSVLDQFDVLTSAAIQERYFNAVKRRERVSVISEYLLIDINKYINPNNVNINTINVSNNKQSRVEESREDIKKTTERAYEPQQIDPPEDVQAVIDYGAMKNIPSDACQMYYDMRARDNFNRKDMHGNWVPIMNWFKDLALLYRKGALDKQKSNHVNDGHRKKSKGQQAVEFLSR